MNAMLFYRMHKRVLICAYALCIFGATETAFAQFLENPTVLYSITVPSSHSFGWAVADIRDINGDGKKDFAVAANAASRVYIYSGATGTLIRTLTLVPSELNASFGQSVADAGDVNRDGVTDIIVGAIGANSNKGGAYVFSGADGSRLLSFAGEATGDRFGSAVGAAGDINQDGFADVLVGADANDAHGTNSGRAYVFSGRTGVLLRTYESEGAGQSLGGGIALAGDVDRDGFIDHIVGAHNAGTGAGGKAYVYSGRSGVLLYTLLPTSGAAQFGQFFVATAGDVDGDTKPDLYVGDYAANGGTGRAYVFSGIDGSQLYTLPGPTPGDGQGPGRYAGDVNGDHHADIIVGRYTNSSGGAGAGQVAVYSGLDGSVLETFTATTPGGNLGFDAVGLGDVNGDDKVEYLLSAATGDTVYVVSSSLSSTPIPAVSQWGLLVLGICMAIAGTLMIRRQM